MKQLAFYCPLKSPQHPIPSGDREIAKSLLTALKMNTLACEVTLVSELRCYDGKGDEDQQQKILQQAGIEVERILDSVDNLQAWVTYHNYYKAPDLLGLTISQRLNIPYLLIEASIAKSRLEGPWAKFASLADAATSAADVVFYLTEKDRLALAKHQPEKQKLVHLPPFLNQTELPSVPRAMPDAKQLLAVGMHRYGDKLASYRVLADALQYLKTPDWRLSIVGDGPARAEIESMFSVYGARVSFLGELDKTAVAEAYQQASVFVWPGVNEAFGLVYLEAQAAGLPVVAEDRDGVREVIATPQSLVPQGDPRSLAQVVDRLLTNQAEYLAMALAGQSFVIDRHLLDSAARTVSEQLLSVISDKS